MFPVFDTSRKQAPAPQRAAPPRVTPTANRALPTPNAPLHSGCTCGGTCPKCQRARQAMQSNLRIGSSGGALEREADRAASRVTNAQPARVQPRGPGELQLSRQSAGASSASSASAPSSVHRVLSSSGQTLNRSTRAAMESRFGHDFSDVRIHTDAESARSAQAVNAHAYTVGQHIVFDSGQYAPASGAGQKLLAHELAHVVQQSQGGMPLLQRKAAGPGVCDPDNLTSLGTAFIKPEADVKKMRLPEKHLQGTIDADFVLYCPHRSSVPLKKLIPCSTVYWIGDAEAQGKGKGKDEVWAKQDGESMLFWGYVKKSKIHSTLTPECAPKPVENKTAEPKPPAKPQSTYNPDDASAWRIMPGPTPSGEQPSFDEIVQSQALRNRYGHKDCPQDFLEKFVWPGEDLARKMIHHARYALCGALFGDDSKLWNHIARTKFEVFFGNDWKDKQRKIWDVFTRLERALDFGKYTVKCIDGCPDYHYGETELLSDEVRLCYKNLQKNTVPWYAMVLIHELGHAKANLIDPAGEDTMSCDGDTQTAHCYAQLAFELWLAIKHRYNSTMGEDCLDNSLDKKKSRDPANWD